MFQDTFTAPGTLVLVARSRRFLFLRRPPLGGSAQVKANFPSANGATWGVSNKNCFAEFEQNGTDGADKGNRP